MSAREIFRDLLRTYRESLGWTRAEAAQRLQMSASQLEKLERGERQPQKDDPPIFDAVYKAPGVFTRLYDDLATETHPPWFRPRVKYENKAAAITEYEGRGVPGLLQTRAYAEHAFRAGDPFAPAETIMTDVEARLDRQHILARPAPPRVWWVLGESALRHQVGPARVMADQIDHVLSVSEAPNIVLQVLPFHATGSPCQRGPAVVFEFSDEPPVAYLEGWNTGRLVKDPKEVSGISAGLRMITGCAMSPVDTRDLLSKIKGEYSHA